VTLPQFFIVALMGMYQQVRCHVVCGCVASWRSTWNWAFAKFVCFVEFESDVHLPKYIRRFSEHNKIWVGTAPKCPHDCERCTQISSKKKGCLQWFQSCRRSRV